MADAAAAKAGGFLTGLAKKPMMVAGGAAAVDMLFNGGKGTNQAINGIGDLINYLSTLDDSGVDKPFDDLVDKIPFLQNGIGDFLKDNTITLAGGIASFVMFSNPDLKGWGIVLGVLTAMAALQRMGQKSAFNTAAAGTEPTADLVQEASLNTTPTDPRAAAKDDGAVLTAQIGGNGFAPQGNMPPTTAVDHNGTEPDTRPEEPASDLA